MQALVELLLLVVGVLIIALLLYMGAASGNWLAPVCYLAAAVVYFGWYRRLLEWARRRLGLPEDEDDDEPFFPG